MSEEDSGLSREQIARQMEASLGRLRTDYVDLYQCHRYDENTPLDETMEALTRVVQEGKARYIGFSEWSPQNIRDALAMVPEMEKFVSSQPQYSLLWRRPEKEIIPLCVENGISQIVWSPLAQGMLTGKYSADAPPPADSRAASDEMGGFMDRLMQPEVIAAVDRMKPLAGEAGCTMAQFALAWVLREPNIASAIVGASRPEQLDDNAAAVDLEIAPILFEQAEAIAAAIPRPKN
jgi:aryl-alcohol dehydrogenase-like predicted oxidoreductase